MAQAINLNSLLRSIHNAVVDAQRIAEQQHIRQLRNYFTWPTPASDKDIQTLENGKPRMVTIEVANMHPDAGKEVDNDGKKTVPIPSTQKLQIPMLSLVPITAIRIDNMKMDFKVGLKGFMEEVHSSRTRFTPDDPEGHQGPVMIDLGGTTGGFLSGKKEAVAKVTIEFKSGEPSEAIMRINDHLIKSIIPVDLKKE
ncbi:hypothetical protein WSM22_37680 [Cytophagales bacterium WSM2-2]|nr:hypothetical protein WSM22_37680 [Cytophagales bacterium WSM2-2]